MTTQQPHDTNETSPRKVPLSQKIAYAVGATFMVTIVVFMGALFLSGNAQASTSLTKMQESFASHGVTVDPEVAERVRSYCAYSSRHVTTEVIGEYQGSKQLLVVQCHDGDEISDVIVRYPKP